MLLCAEPATKSTVGDQNTIRKRPHTIDSKTQQQQTHSGGGENDGTDDVPHKRIQRHDPNKQKEVPPYKYINTYKQSTVEEGLSLRYLYLILNASLVHIIHIIRDI